MQPIKKKDLTNSLTKKGFTLCNSSHQHYIFYVNGKKTTIRTMVSHNEKEIRDPLQHDISKQMKISIKQLHDFVDCSFSQEKYLEHLIKNGFIDVSA